MFRVDMVDSRRNERSYQRDLRIILAGPGLNFLLAALCFPVYLLLPYQWLGMFFSANLLVGFFNIQPIATLDGGAAVYAILSVRLGEKKASFWASFFSFVILVPLAALGFWILLRNPSVSYTHLSIGSDISPTSRRPLSMRSRIFPAFPL